MGVRERTLKILILQPYISTRNDLKIGLNLLQDVSSGRSNGTVSNYVFLYPRNFVNKPPTTEGPVGVVYCTTDRLEAHVLI